MKKRLLLLILSLITVFSLSACAYTFKTTGINGDYHKGNGLKLGYEYVYGYYNPLIYEDETYEDVLDLVYLKLFSKDRNNNYIYDIKDESGKEIDGYIYTSPASLRVTETENNTFKYVITLKDGIASNTGAVYDSKDLLFTYYVMFDPSNENIAYMSLPVKGLSEYYNDLNSKTKYSEAHIEGIRTLSDRMLEIETTRELNETEKRLLNVYIVSHSFVDDDIPISPQTFEFGFTKGDITYLRTCSFIEKATGPYYIKRIRPNTIILNRNRNCFNHISKIDELKIERLGTYVMDDDNECIIGGGDAFYQINQKWIDIAEVVVTDEIKTEISRYNMSSTTVGNCITLYEIEGTNKGIVYSTQRIDGSTVEKAGFNKYYSIEDLITYINFK